MSNYNRVTYFYGAVSEPTASSSTAPGGLLRLLRSRNAINVVLLV